MFMLRMPKEKIRQDFYTDQPKSDERFFRNVHPIDTAIPIEAFEIVYCTSSGFGDGRAVWVDLARI